MTTFIYFMRMVEGVGPIKVGCTRHLGTRLEQLAQWSPVDLEVLASGEGDFRLERFIHKQFEIHHQRREWFTATPALIERIELVKSGVPVIDAFGAERRYRTRWGSQQLYYVRRAA